MPLNTYSESNPQMGKGGGGPSCAIAILISRTRKVRSGEDVVFSRYPRTLESRKRHAQTRKYF